MTPAASDTLRVTRSYAVGLAAALLVLVAPLDVTGPASTVTLLVAVALCAAVLLLATGLRMTTPLRPATAPRSGDDAASTPAARLVDPPLFPVRPRAPGLG
jgi:hypothetical protein